MTPTTSALTNKDAHHDLVAVMIVRLNAMVVAVREVSHVWATTGVENIVLLALLFPFLGNLNRNAKNRTGRMQKRSLMRMPLAMLGNAYTNHAIESNLAHFFGKPCVSEIAIQSQLSRILAFATVQRIVHPSEAALREILALPLDPDA
jgi:hypothetical protein